MRRTKARLRERMVMTLAVSDTVEEGGAAPFPMEENEKQNPRMKTKKMKLFAVIQKQEGLASKQPVLVVVESLLRKVEKARRPPLIVLAVT